ncbi:MAG TPA: hypothetical protein VGK67_27840 [Myxococcales bacterium]|jgi:hypothetical protein
MKRRRNPVLIAVGLTALLALTCGIREDELRCEEAVAHLADCCPGFDPTQIDCYYSTGCGTIYPVIDIQESRCVSGMKCEDLVAAGVCSRAQAARFDDGRRVCP